MRVAHFDLIGGAAGNMLLGALVDAGVEPAALERALRTIPVDGWRLEHSRVVRRGIAASYVDFAVAGEDGAPGEHRAHGHHLHDVLDILARSGLSAAVRERATAIYRRLGEAEARVHGVALEAIHFHEVGQIDAILDVAGVCVALELLGVEQVTCSPFPLGHGTIAMHHGRYPNPPPATAELLRGAPTIAVDVAGELVTTTAAAILTSLVAEPGSRSSLRFEQIGYGAGRHDYGIPNVTRAIVGTLATEAPIDGLATDEVVVLEANIDDMSPQAYELAIERLFAAGALDVWTAPIGMKKQRPGVLLTVLAAPSAADRCARAVLRETTSLGVRRRHESRWTLPRAIEGLTTPYGTVRCKRIETSEGIRTTLEYDDVARIARERGRPFVQTAAELTRLIEAMEKSDERHLV